MDDCKEPEPPTFRTEYIPTPITINSITHNLWTRGRPSDHKLYFEILSQFLSFESSATTAAEGNTSLTDLQSLVREYIFSHDSDEDKEKFELLLMKFGGLEEKNEKLIRRFETWLATKLSSGEGQQWKHASEEVRRARVVDAEFRVAQKGWKIDAQKRAYDQEQAAKKREREEQEKKEMEEQRREAEQREKAELENWSTGDCW